MSQQVSPETLRSALQSLAARLGKTPTVVDMHEEGEYDPKQYQEVFGGWNEALEAAGLDPDEMGSKRIPDRELLAELQRLYSELGTPPTQRDMTERGEYSNRTYQLRFGSWSKALQEAMLETNDGISEADLLADLRRLADELGGPPTTDDVREEGTFSLRVYYDRFDSFSAARERALDD